MSINAIGTTPASYPPRADGDSAAVEAAESRKTKAAEQANGGIAPKAAPTPAKAQASSKASSSSNDANIIRQLAAQHVSFAAIAQRLGKSVSTILQEAAAAGINLNSASTANASIAAAAQNKDTEAVGAKVDVKA